jgi:predicted nucleic acid-binding protein
MAKNGTAASFMSDKIFIDTNIFIYSLDKHDSEKRHKARSILNHILKKYSGVISTQVMQEFYVAATKKMHGDPITIKGILNQLLNFEVVSISPELIFSTIDCSILNRISFWDALIIIAAASSKCKEIWTEDLSHDQIIQGIRINNPFL